MPKMKTNRAVAKRFRVTASGKLKRTKSGKQHNCKELKNSKRLRGLRKPGLVDKTMEKNYKRVLPYL